MGVYWASQSTVPDVVTFVAGCPVDPGHPAEWTEHREDTRTRASWWCPVCEAGAEFRGGLREAAS